MNLFVKTIKKVVPRSLMNKKYQYSVRKQYKIEEKLFKKFISNFDDKQCKHNNGMRIVFYIPPWHGTSVVWFSSALALFCRKMGCDVVIVIDDIISYDENDTSTESACIQKALIGNLLGLVTLKLLSSFEEAEVNEADLAIIDKLADLKKVHHLRSAFFDDLCLKNKYKDLLSEAFPYIRSVLKQYSSAVYVVPGGVCGNTGLFYYEGEKLGTRIVSYDSGIGTLLIGTDDIAAQLRDIKKSFEMLASDKKWLKKAEQFADRELEIRLLGKDRHGAQKARAGKCESFDIIIPLNIDWDTAALGVHNLFSSTLEWLVETVEFILEKTNYTVAVRQHPIERSFDSCIYAEKFMVERFGMNKRFRFISCHDEINSYSLISEAKIVLPLSSTIGIESAMMGKVVIVCSNCYYASFPVVLNAEDKDEYFKLILETAGGNIVLSDEQIQFAKAIYYLSQCCNWIYTDFTPNPEEFKKWADIDFEELFARDEVQKILKSILDNVPIALLSHEELMT